jgi:WD40 repeat protein
VTARRPRLPERFVRWLRREPRLAGSLLTAALCLLLALVVAVVGATRLSAARDEADRSAAEARGQAEKAERANEQANKARETSEATLADTRLAFGLAADDQGAPDRALLWFAGALAVSPGGPERRQADLSRCRAWSRPLTSPARAFAAGEFVNRLVIHPGGRHLLAFGTSGPTLWDVAAEARLTAPGPPGALTAAAWSPDGSRLAVGRAGFAGLYAFPGGQTLQSWRLGAVTAAAFSPDGRLVAFAAGDRAVVWDEGARRLAAVRLPAPVRTVAFTPAGDQLLVESSDQRARLFAMPPAAGPEALVPAVAAPHSPVLTQSGQPQAPVLVGDGLVVHWSGQLSCLDRRTGRVLWRVKPPFSFLTGLAASPGGYYLAACGAGLEGGGARGYGGWGGECRLYDAATGRQVGGVLRHPNEVFQAAFSADGRLLLTAGADRTARVWSVPEGEPVTPHLPHQGRVFAAAFAPSGRAFATAQEDGVVRAWRLGGGDALPGHRLAGWDDA